MWDHVITDAKYLIMNHLDVEAPMIAAVNGPALIHAELALLCDIVLASETAVFQDRRIFRAGWCLVMACTWYSRCCSEPIAGAIFS